MTTTVLSMLDQAELMQLAQTAGAGDDAGAAIAYLKEAVSRSDATAFAHFLLGAEYAQIKMYDRAVEEMEAAVALDPALSIARLQLGLLWLTSGVAERALGVLAPLEELGASDPMRAFAAGLRCLIGDQFDAAIAHLEEGIVLNTANAALNGDMQQLIDGIRTVAGGATDKGDEGQHLFLSAYTGNTSH